MRLQPRPFPPPLGPRLRGALAAAHAREPFSPSGVRDAAHRVRAVAGRLGLEAAMFRGGLDLGGVELDHVWVVVDRRVVDVAFPLFAERFVDAIRGYVLGEVDAMELERLAHPYSVRWRVLGAYPRAYSYTGEPVWSETHANPAPAHAADSPGSARV